jgi:hypothetical protein
MWGEYRSQPLSRRQMLHVRTGQKYKYDVRGCRTGSHRKRPHIPPRSYGRVGGGAPVVLPVGRFSAGCLPVAAGRSSSSRPPLQKKRPSLLLIDRQITKHTHTGSKENRKRRRQRHRGSGSGSGQNTSRPGSSRWSHGRRDLRSRLHHRYLPRTRSSASAPAHARAVAPGVFPDVGWPRAPEGRRVRHQKAQVCTPGYGAQHCVDECERTAGRGAARQRVRAQRAAARGASGHDRCSKRRREKQGVGSDTPPQQLPSRDRTPKRGLPAPRARSASLSSINVQAVDSALGFGTLAPGTRLQRAKHKALWVRAKAVRLSGKGAATWHMPPRTPSTSRTAYAAK